MKPKEDLFQLIQSLSKSEKGYFKKYAGVHVRGNGANHYLKLFDVISGMEEYDESIVRKKMADTPVLAYLPTAKNQLFQLILKVLRAYREDNYLSIRLKDQLDHIEFLFERGLFVQCENLVQRAMKMAEQQDDLMAIRDLMFWDARLLLREPGASEKCRARALRILDDHDAFTKKLMQHEELWRDILALQLKDYLKKVEELPIEKLEEGEESYRIDNDRVFQKLYSFRELLKGKKMFTDQDEAFFRKGLEVSDPERSTLNKEVHLELLRRKALAELEEDHPDFQATLSQLMELEEKWTQEQLTSLSVRATFFSCTLQIRSLKNMDCHQERTALLEKVLPKVENVFSALAGKEKAAVSMELSLAFFSTGQFRKSLSWLNKAEEDPHVFLPFKYPQFLRIYRMMIYYELENFDLIEYQIKSIIRKSKTKEGLHDEERMILDFLKKRIRQSPDQDLFNELKQISDQIERNPSPELQVSRNRYIDHHDWLRSKIREASADYKKKPADLKESQLS